MASSINLRSIMDNNKLTGANFLDWYRNLRIVLKFEKIDYVLDTRLPSTPAFDAFDTDWAAYRRHLEDNDMAQCIMLASMSSELQKQHESMDAHTIIFHLKELFGEIAQTERYETSKLLFRARMVEDTSVYQHVIKMKGYIERLSTLGYTMDHELSIDLILQSLPDSYAQFVLNYVINDNQISISKLVNLLKTIEPTIKQLQKSVILVDSYRFSSSKKEKGKGKKTKSVIKSQSRVTKKKENASKGICFHCGKNGHWKRNCKVYIESLKKKKALDAAATTSGL